MRDTIIGRINDVDSHEMIPTHLWAEHFGEAAAALVPLLDRRDGGSGGQNSLTRPDVSGDETAITAETVWNVKGPSAPGSIDGRRRLEVMDTMGIARQLVFPSGPGIVSLFLAAGTPETVGGQFGVDASDMDLDGMARALAAGHNDWATRFASYNADRLRPVGVLPTRDLDAAIIEAKRLLDAGLRAVCIPTSVPPGGISPADEALDPFWSMFEEANAAVLLHIGGEFGFMSTRVWGDIPTFLPAENSSLEAPLDPYSMSTLHMGAQNFLTVLVLGGVFERHPNLRFGVIELGAYWVGPLAENLDMWHEMFRFRLKDTLKAAPSEYIKRNVRVTPFYFEPLDRYIDRYGLDDVYCFSSDFPHVEGGKTPLADFSGKLGKFDDSLFEKFFVENGRLLLPT